MLFELFFLRMLVPSADCAFGIDIACFGEGDFGEHRSDQFINKHGKERDLLYDSADLRIEVRTHNDGCHTQRNACLRQQRDTQIFHDIVVATGELCAQRSTAVFAYRTAENVYCTDENDPTAREYRKVKLCAAYHEKDDEKGRCPTVYSVHKLFGEIADIAENCAEHHAGE